VATTNATVTRSRDLGPLKRARVGSHCFSFLVLALWSWGLRHVRPCRPIAARVGLLRAPAVQVHVVAAGCASRFACYQHSPCSLCWLVGRYLEHLVARTQGACAWLFLCGRCCRAHHFLCWGIAERTDTNAVNHHNRHTTGVFVEICPPRICRPVIILSLALVLGGRA